MIRTFIAINIPDMVRSEIAKFQSELKIHRADVKWVRPESMHITLKFLGNVKEENMSEVARCVGEAAHGYKPFTVEVSGVGTFPNERRPRVLWIGVKSGAEILSELASRVDGALSGMGFEREKRRYSAHLTLGRVRSPNRIQDVVNAMTVQGFEAKPFDVTELDVMKSELLRTGAVYTAMERIKLVG